MACCSLKTRPERVLNSICIHLRLLIVGAGDVAGQSKYQTVHGNPKTVFYGGHAHFYFIE